MTATVEALAAAAATAAAGDGTGLPVKAGLAVVVVGGERKGNIVVPGGAASGSADDKTSVE
jgi:hypothetical protein